MDNKEKISLIKATIRNTDVYQEFTESIPVMVYAYRNSKVIYVNPAVEKALGYTFEEMLQKNFWDICHPDYKELVKNRGLSRLKGEKVPVNYEFKILKKNGEEMWVDVFFSSIVMDGEPTVILGAYDITERKLLKEQLQMARESLERRVQQRTNELYHKNQELTLLNQKLYSIIGNISCGVVVVHLSGEIEILNSALIQNQSPKIHNTIKRKLSEMVINETNSLINDMFKRQKEFQHEELIFPSEEGQIHLLASGVPLVNDKGTANSGLLILRPIKEIHQLVNRFSGSKATFCFEDIITSNKAMLEMIQSAKTAASGNSNILIEGESGTGKELFAQAIHNYSPRKKGPFIAVNCGAIPRELVGSELFGYVEGAFTGARKGGNPGKFELASGGTIFLDEIGDMPFEQQAALLRVIQEKSITRIGGAKLIPVDVRIICATNKNLQEAIKMGRFRQDLYYRLKVISINLPSLRERKEDIPLLFQHFLKNKYSYYQGNHELERHLQAYTWPGNVRELENVIERMVNSARGSNLGLEHIPSEVFNQASKTCIFNHFNYFCSYPDAYPHSNAPFYASPSSNDDSDMTLLDARERNQKLREEEERKQICNLLDLHHGNVSRVAKEMGISRTTLYKKMKQYTVKKDM